MWKRTSAQVYIRGEEILGGWRPRGLSLVEDHHSFEKALALRVDLEIAKCRAKGTFEPQEGSEEEYLKLLQYCIDLWKIPSRDHKPFVPAIEIGINFSGCFQERDIGDTVC